MKERPNSAEDVIRWIDKAEHDLLAAEHTMQLVGSGLTDIICFHCQQCAEKYLKALLVSLGVHFPKTHDLRLLLDLVPEHVLLDLRRTRVIPLNRYVIEGRYPGEWEPITAEEAREALAMAREVRAAVRAKLPDEMLDPGK
jgi:HEPN domain-containing protein